MAETSPEDVKATLRLKRYWLYGPGRAKWDRPPHPWTQLYHELRKYIKSDREAKATAAKWYHEAKGVWPNSDAARVMQGKPPRGKRIGPG